MRLYTRWQNSAGERVRIALNLKGIDYKYVPVAELTLDEYQDINPQGLLPTLKIDGQFIAQSSAILEFLEEEFPEPRLLPADAILRAQSRSFAAHISSEIHALTVKRVRRRLGEAVSKDWVEFWHESGFAALEETLARRQHTTTFCFSEMPGWAELHLIPQLANARRFDVNLSAYPLLLEVERKCVGLTPFIIAQPKNQLDFPHQE